ncbi:hypothetical protein ccbrp13_37470 [Ktedonobacteria bacterium brp13]|nr:hypothetical protein ccbrp13_37470 [Ktedonobacteria bacterium brp13]
MKRFFKSKLVISPVVTVALLASTLLMALVGPIHYAHASGVPYQFGDVFAGVGNGLIDHYSPTGTLLDTLNTGSASLEETGMCFDAAGNLRSTNWTANNMSEFDNQGNRIQFPWGGPFNLHPESCVVDSSGNVYVGQEDGSGNILKFTPAGTLLNTYHPAPESRGAGPIALESNQCTMLYTSAGNLVKSFNVCTNTQNANFTPIPLGGQCWALAIRANGEVMVACTTHVYRLSATGTVIQTYPISGEFLFALDLDPDGTHFWVGGYHSKKVYKVDIATGTGTTAPVFTATGGGPFLSGLAVFGKTQTPLTETAILNKTSDPHQDSVVPDGTKVRYTLNLTVFNSQNDIQAKKITMTDAYAPANGTTFVKDCSVDPDSMANWTLTNNDPSGLTFTGKNFTLSQTNPSMPVPLKAPVLHYTCTLLNSTNAKVEVKNTAQAQIVGNANEGNILSNFPEVDIFVNCQKHEEPDRTHTHLR